MSFGIPISREEREAWQIAFNKERKEHFDYLCALLGAPKTAKKRARYMAVAELHAKDRADRVLVDCM